MKWQFESGNEQALVPALYPLPFRDYRDEELQTLPFNEQELLERVGNDLQLLADIVTMFQEDALARVGQLEAAFASRDSNALQRAAHSLKGMLLNFAAVAAVETALAIENLGISKRWTFADELLSTMTLQVNQLNVSLDRYVTRVAA